MCIWYIYITINALSYTYGRVGVCFMYERVGVCMYVKVYINSRKRCISVFLTYPHLYMMHARMSMHVSKSTDSYT